MTVPRCTVPPSHMPQDAVHHPRFCDEAQEVYFTPAVGTTTLRRRTIPGAGLSPETLLQKIGSGGRMRTCDRCISKPFFGSFRSQGLDRFDSCRPAGGDQTGQHDNCGEQAHRPADGQRIERAQTEEHRAHAGSEADSGEGSDDQARVAVRCRRWTAWSRRQRRDCAEKNSQIRSVAGTGAVGQLWPPVS